MEWIQVLTIIGVIGGFLIYHANRVDNQVLATNQRMDQLYNMFVDLLKEGKK